MKWWENSNIGHGNVPYVLDGQIGISFVANLQKRKPVVDVHTSTKVWFFSPFKPKPFGSLRSSSTPQFAHTSFSATQDCVIRGKTNGTERTTDFLGKWSAARLTTWKLHLKKVMWHSQLVTHCFRTRIWKPHFWAKKQSAEKRALIRFQLGGRPHYLLIVRWKRPVMGAKNGGNLAFFEPDNKWVIHVVCNF